MKILLYGRLADALGREVELASAGDCSIGEIKARLAADHPACAQALERARGIINGAIVADDLPVGRSDAVELIPPVSGG